MLTVFALCLAIGLTLAAQPRSPKIDPMYGHPEPQPFDIDIIPPWHYPGDVIKSIDHTKVDHALNEVMDSGGFRMKRCAMALSNEGKALLSNPKWTITSGGTHSALPKEVPSGHSGLNLFFQTAGAARGSVGVLSYDIAGTNHKVVVMWYVPFDRNLFDNSFNMKVYERRVAVDKNLVAHLKKQGAPLPPTGWHTRTEYGVKLSATMTDIGKAKLIVTVNADGFDPNGSYNLMTECKYHPGKVRKFCKQECYGGGWCWVRIKCKHDSQCAGRHGCMSGC